MERILRPISEHLSTFLDKLVEFIPDLIVIVIIVISGFIAAYLAYILLGKGFRAVRFEAWSDQAGLTTAFRKAGIKAEPSAFISSFAYWFIVVLFFVAGFATLGLRVTDALVSVFLLYIPRFFSALVIVILGYFAANYLARAVLIAAVNSGIERSRLLSETLRVLLFVLVAAMALEELAVAPRVVLAAFTIFFAAIGLGFAVSFGAAGRDYAKRAIDHLLSKKDENERDQL